MLRKFTCLRKQKGIASLLAVLFIGFAMTALVVGIASTVKNSQDASVAALGQTHAQILSAAGYQALGKVLADSNKSQSEIASIASGSIAITGVDPNSSISYIATPVAYCPVNPDPSKNNFCFDITSQSKGSTSKVRAIYSSTESLAPSTLTGSVFAGGLTVGGSAKFTGDLANPVSVRVGGEGFAIDTSGKKVDLSPGGIAVSKFDGGSFIGADQLRKYANYIFGYSNKIVCTKNNLGSLNAEAPCDSGDSIGVTYASNTWTIDPAKILPGVYWFSGNVNIETRSDIPLVNTIIATGSLNVTQPKNAKGDFKSFSPSFFYNQIKSDNVNLTKNMERICGKNTTQLPSQYCKTNSELKDLNSLEASVANILFFSGDALTLDSANNTNNFFYGNMIASSGRGGTGSASAKFTGSGNLNIIGNIINSGSTRTTMTGNINIDLSHAFTGGNYVPGYKFVYSLQGIRYL